MENVFGIRSAPMSPEVQRARSVQVPMKNRLGWLVSITVLVYVVVQAIPSSVLNQAVSYLASAVWGN
jgi:hypothetical protein